MSKIVHCACEAARRSLPLLPVSLRFTLEKRVVGLECTMNASLGRAGKNKLAMAHFAKRKPVIAAFQKAIDRHLDYAKHETLKKVENYLHSHANPTQSANAGGGVAADLVFNRGEFADGLLAAVRGESAKALQTAGKELFAEIGRDDPFEMPDPKAIEFLDRRKNLLKGVADEVHQAIENEVKAGLDKGETISEMAKRISGKFEEISQGRATTIASTETGAAYGFGRQEAMGAAGIEFKRWLTSHLPTVRDAHAEAEDDPDNQMVPIDEPFMVGGEELMFPGDEMGSPENTINCHCVALSVIPEWKEGDGL